MAVSGFSSRIRYGLHETAYIVSGLPKYRPARRTASIPIRPCLQDCAREPGNAPRRCSALSVCRPSPELVASRKASLEQQKRWIDLSCLDAIREWRVTRLRSTPTNFPS